MRATAVLGLLLLGGCKIWIGTSARDRQRDALREHRREWEAARLRNYQYTYQIACFCAPDYTTPRYIFVREGNVSAVIDSATGQPSHYQSPAESPTIDSLFARAERALDDERAHVEIDYDPALGFPSRISYDVPSFIDEEYVIRARNFGGLALPAATR